MVIDVITQTPWERWWLHDQHAIFKLRLVPFLFFGPLLSRLRFTFRLTLSRLATFRRTFTWRTKHPPEWRWPPVVFIFRRQFIFKVLPKEGLVEIGTFTCVHLILVQGDNESLVQFYVPAHTTMLDPEPWTIRKRYVMFAYPNLGDPSIALLERSHSFVAELMSTEAIARVLHYGFREWIEPQ